MNLSRFKLNKKLSESLIKILLRYDSSYFSSRHHLTNDTHLEQPFYQCSDHHYFFHHYISIISLIHYISICRLYIMDTVVKISYKMILVIH